MTCLEPIAIECFGYMYSVNTDKIVKAMDL